MATSLSQVKLLNGWTLDPQWRSRLAQWLSNRFGGRIAATDILKLSALAFRNCASIVIKGMRPVWVGLKVIGAMMKRPAHEGVSRIVMDGDRVKPEASEASEVKAIVPVVVESVPVTPAAAAVASNSDPVISKPVAEVGSDELTAKEKMLVKSGNQGLVTAYLSKNPDREIIVRRAIDPVAAEVPAPVAIEVAEVVAPVQAKRSKPAKNPGMGFGAKGKKEKEVKDWIARHTVKAPETNCNAEYSIDYSAVEPLENIPEALHGKYRQLATNLLESALRWRRTGEGRGEELEAKRDAECAFIVAFDGADRVGTPVSNELMRQYRAFKA